MKLSVIVPVYNAERFLNRCVDSILAQTVEDKEIILINDSSPDNSLSIMEDYAARFPDHIIIKTVPNHRQGAARNAGIELASGEFLGFVDSDDWIAPDMYEKLIDAAERENADVAMCDFANYYETTESTETESAYNNNPYGIGSSCNKVFRRKCVGDIRFPADLWYEDFYFSARIMLCGASTVYVPEALYTYRIGHESTMHNNHAERNLDIIAILKQLHPDIPDKKVFESMVISHVLIDAIGRVSESTDSNRNAVLTQLRDYACECLPHLTASQAFREESKNRQAAALLNYYGLDRLTEKIVRLKAAIRKKP